MASTYPTALDVFTNPLTTNPLTAPSHAQQHSDINDAVEALEAKVAIGNTVLGTYTNYTPTVSNITLGNAAFAVKYARVNNLVHYYGAIVFGTTTVITGTAFNLSLPINCAAPLVNHFIPCGTSGYYDASSGAVFSGDVIGIGGASVVRLRIYVTNGAYAQTVDLSSTVPFTWTTGDKIEFSITYEAA